jgi:hypothetical protein
VPARTVLSLVLVWWGLGVPRTASAQEPAPGPAPGPPEVLVRELFVPFDALSGVVGGDNQRVFLSRAEYDQLIAEAARRPPTAAPQAWVLLSATYEAAVREHVALLRGVLEVETLQSGLHAVPLPLAGIELRGATLNGQPARLARDPQGQIVLLARDSGRHRLELEGHIPVTVSAAEQSLQVRLPATGSSRLALTVPGNVEVKSGASVVDRTYDSAADQTRFELLLENATLAVVMSLNNRRLSEDRVVLARSVQVAELTTAYERLHATMDMQVVHGAVERFVFAVPAGFQVTNVTSPRLAQWLIRPAATGELLEVVLREPVRDPELLQLAAIRAPVVLGTWSMPTFEPREVAGQVAVLGLLAESRLRPQSVSTDGLIRIDTSVLRSALPPSVFEAEAGAPAIRPLAAGYAPGGAATFGAVLEDPRDEVRVVTHLQLTLEESQQTLRGGFTLTPQAAQQTTFAFQLPRAWQLEQLQGADNTGLAYQPFSAEAYTRYVVTLPQAVEPGQSVSVYFQAVLRTSGWLGDWASQDVEFPVVTVEQATRTDGVIALEPTGDLVAQPLNLDGLTVLDAQDRGRFGLADAASELTYRVTGDTYQATFRVERTQPRIAARNYAFFQIREGVLSTHAEAVFTVKRARTQRLQLELPDSTPTALSIRGLRGLELKEFSRATQDGKHVWTVLLANAQAGTVALAVDFEQALASAAADVELPLLRAVGVDYQTLMVSIEGDPALDIDLQSQMRRIDVGELAEAEYMPGRRLLGAFASTAEADTVRATIARRELHPLPAAIVQRAELVTVVSTAGVSQSAARYLLQTKLPFLTIELPAGAELWSVTLGGEPVKPRRRGEQIVLSLQSDQPGLARDLQVVYEAPVSHVAWIGQIRTPAPRLLLAPDEQAVGIEVPQVDLVWYVHLPTGYALARVDGTVFTSDLPPVVNPWRSLADAGKRMGGGLGGPVLWTALAARSESRAARRASALATATDARPLPAPSADRPALGYPLPAPGDGAGMMGMPGGGPGMGAQAGGYSYPGMPFGGTPGQNTYGMMPGMGGEVGGMGGMGAGMTPAAGAPAAGEEGLMPGGMPTPPPTEAMAAPQAAAADDVASLAQGQVILGGAPVAPANEPSDALPQAATTASPPTTAEPEPAQGKLTRYWALQGLRGLSIDLDPSSSLSGTATLAAGAPGPLTFRSLGADPQLDIGIYDRSRMSWLAWAVALIILVVGLLQTRAKVSRRMTWVLVLALLACGLPLIGGPCTAFELVFQRALQALFLLVPLWIAVACLERMAGSWRRVRERWSTVRAAALVLIAWTSVAMLPPCVSAQDVPNLTDLLKPLLDQDRPVKIPDDAVVIPYDPTDLEGLARAEKVLVPYPKYVELWNAAHPDQLIGDRQVPHEYALAGAQYEAVLDEGEELSLRGRIELELLDDEPVEIPLALAEGVITAAQLDGQPARLKAAAPAAAPAATDGGQTPPVPPVLLLVAEGRGPHQLDLTVRVAVKREGGWQQVVAVLPHADATALNLQVSQAGSTVRRRLGSLTVSDVTAAANQSLSATLAEGGQLDLAWRGPFTEGAVDQGLTATSSAVVDVREDGVRVVWRVEFAFGQTERNLFRLEIPPEYLVEQIDGANVRGWDVVTESERRFVHVELLKAVRQSEQMTVRMSRHLAFSPGAAAQVAVPAIAAPDAALQRGTIQIRRSPILELQTGEDQGVSRTDAGQLAEQLVGSDDRARSPLGIRDFQAYRFTAVPFTLALTVSHVPARVSAELRTLFRLGETAAAVESDVRIVARDRALFQVRIAIPEDLELERVAAEGLGDWSIARPDAQRTLTAFFPAGQVGTFSIVLAGQLRDHTSTDAVPLPQLAVRDVDQQQGTIVVQADHSLDARPDGLEQVRPVLLDRVTAWLAEAQRPLARLALEYQGAVYRGTIVLAPRAPRVTCVTVTNVRVTYREIQETILLDFQIAEAGVRSISFRLPAWLRLAHIAAPRLRQKRVEPIEGEDNVRVTLELQDAIIGQYRVVLEHDRAILPGRLLAALPHVETGTTSLRYVTLENVGRDELLPDGTPGMEPVARPSRQWDELAARLQGGQFADAFVTAQSGPDVEFGYRLKQREMVRTAGANIGLARTQLVLDPNGAYRAALWLTIDNRTEPYLEIELPPGAALWAAHVAEEGVKPAQSPGDTSGSRLRIPLIKTAEGDLDYPVVLRYAGQLARVRSLRAVDLPFIRTTNIQPELSQVKLFLPDEFRWVHFDGTATRVAGEEDFQAAYVAYRTQQVEKLTQILRGSNAFSKSRAALNVRYLGEELKVLQQEGRRAKAAQLRENLASNSLVLQAATEEMARVTERMEESEDNRDRLQVFFRQQGNSASRNEAVRLNLNFAYGDAASATQLEAGKPVEKFDTDWFAGQSGRGMQIAQPPSAQPAEQAEGKMRFGTGRVQDEKRKLTEEAVEQQLADDTAQQVFQHAPSRESRDESAESEVDRDPAADTAGAMGRAYVDKMERQAGPEAAPAQQQAQVLADSAGRPLARSAGADFDVSDGMSVTGQLAAVGPLGLTSLEFELPERGTTYYFTTPRGNVTLTARPLETRVLHRVTSVLGLVALAAAMWLVWQLARRMIGSRSRRIVAGATICLAGILLLLLIGLPVYGLAIFVGGVLVMLGENSTRRPDAAVV